MKEKWRIVTNKANVVNFQNIEPVANVVNFQNIEPVFSMETMHFSSLVTYLPSLSLIDNSVIFAFRYMQCIYHISIFRDYQQNQKAGIYHLDL